MSLFRWYSIVFQHKACQINVCRWKKQVELTECFTAVLLSLKPILFLLKQNFTDSCRDRGADSGQQPACAGTVPRAYFKSFLNQAHALWDLNSYIL